MTGDGEPDGTEEKAGEGETLPDEGTGSEETVSPAPPLEALPGEAPAVEDATGEFGDTSVNPEQAKNSEAANEADSPG